MFPILAIGAALLTGAVVASSASKAEKPSNRNSGESSGNAPLPQSYIVTPIAGKYVQSGQALSMVDAVGKIIV